MSAATGRDLQEVEVAASCLLTLLGLREPSIEQTAAVHILAFWGLELREIKKALGG